MARSDTFLRICALAGPAVEAVDPRDGWPGIARVRLSGGDRLVALHVSQVSSHARKEYERRFQNPADRRPVSAFDGAIPILCGLAESQGEPVLVALPGQSRVGRNARFSILFHSSILAEAAFSGWSEYKSSTGELIVGFRPALLPVFVDATAHEVLVDPNEVRGIASAAGMLDGEPDDTTEGAERVRAASSRIVRRAAFGKEVCRAYENRCAMCGIGLNLLEGAHIYPASAPGSRDETWNGLALCRNHHRLFDRHRIWIEPTHHDVVWHPDILASRADEPIVANLVDNTRDRIAVPRTAGHRPRSAMFDQRYEFMATHYDWVRN